MKMYVLVNEMIDNEYYYIFFHEGQVSQKFSPVRIPHSYDKG